MLFQSFENRTHSLNLITFFVSNAFCDFFLNQFHNNLLSSNSSARSHSSKDNQVMFLFLSKVSIMMLLRYL
jgi:hypothetical protein